MVPPVADRQNPGHFILAVGWESHVSLSGFESSSGRGMQVGTVKWFNAKKGFGFVVVDGFEQDIFVHYSVIVGDGFKTLSEGDAVDIEFGDDGRGPRARHVKRVEPPADA